MPNHGILDLSNGIVKKVAVAATKTVFDAIDTLSDGVLNACPYCRAADGICIDRDIVYELNSPLVCVFDRYFAPENSGVPAVIIIHGGGFSSGDKKHRRALAHFLASEGYGAFCVNFSLMGECEFPQPLKELVKAVNHIGDNAELYGIDPNKIYVTGDSSGAYYAAMLGAFMCGKGLADVVGEKLRYGISGLILNCGIYDLDTALKNKVGFITGGIMNGFFKDEYSGRCMPTDFIDGGFPPTFLVYSERDVFCRGQGEALIKKLNCCGVYNECYKARHAYSNHCFCLFWRGEDAHAANELMRSFVKRLSGGKINVR
ncbi:MAG: alpha/beta hydrolase [Clostridiales bacterium]|nr:alpha/beta hydrolase [Clostridiales bacterium]